MPYLYARRALLACSLLPLALVVLLTCSLLPLALVVLPSLLVLCCIDFTLSLLCRACLSGHYLRSYAMYTYAGSNEPDVEGGAYRPYNNYFLNNALDTPVVCKIKEADGIVMTGSSFSLLDLGFGIIGVGLYMYIAYDNHPYVYCI